MGRCIGKKIKSISEYYQQHLGDFHETKHMSVKGKEKYLNKLYNN